MELDSDRIRSLIASWKVSESREDLRLIKGLIGSYIYFFPKLAYKASVAFCAEFYLFVDEKLPSILRSYPLDSPYLFKSWLNQVLIYKYADFSKQSPFDLPAKALLPEDLPMEEAEVKEAKASLLSPGEETFLLFCESPSYMQAKDMLILSEFCGCSISLVLECYGRICAFHDQRSERLAEESFALGRLDEALLRLARRIQNSVPQQKEALQIKAARLEARRKRLLNQRSAADRQVRAIASALWGDAEKARRILVRIKQKIRYAQKASLRRYDAPI